VKHAERFASRLATSLTLIGVAIGLGNVWRFPYMMGRYGGSAFLLLYVAVVVLFAIPMLCAEFALGRATREGQVGAYRASLGRRTGSALGGLLALAVLVMDSYYLVVVGNVTYTTWFAAASGFHPDQLPRYQAGLADGTLQYFFAFGVLALGTWTLVRGVNRGIEAASRVLVPLFGLIVLYMIGYVMTLPGIGARIVAFLQPDFSLIGVREVFAAVGHAFFSNSVGGTFMVVYGNYVANEVSLPAAANHTALSDTFTSLMAAMFVVPAILYFGLDMAQGPGLIFSTFPKLFDLMPGGRWVGAWFLLAFDLMGFLSAMAALEVCVSALRDITGIARTPAVLVVGALEAVLIWPCAHSSDLVATLDLFLGSGTQIFGAIVAAVALTYGLGRATTLGQIFGGRDTWWTGALFLWLRFILPGVLFVLLVLYVIDSVKGGA
jgi:NSS family neurotransmitter:Na+ symporter